MDPIGHLTKKESTMTKRKRRHDDANFKVHVVLTTLQEGEKLAELASAFDVVWSKNSKPHGIGVKSFVD